MRFYEITGDVRSIDHEYDEEEFNGAEQYARSGEFRWQLQTATKRFSSENNNSGSFGFARIDSKELFVFAVTEKSLDMIAEAKRLLKMCKISATNLEVNEVTFKHFTQMLRSADRRNYIEDEDEIIFKHGLDEVCSRIRHCIGWSFAEGIITPISKKSEKHKISRLLTSSDLKEEITRIEADTTSQEISGHPVHYIIQADDEEARIATIDLLLNQLYKNKRITNKRVCSIECRDDERIGKSFVEELYSMNSGGTIITSFHNFKGFEGNHAHGSLRNLEVFCENMRANRNDVLSILVLPKECSQIKNYIFENLGTLSFVEIGETVANSKESKRLLRLMAKDNKVAPSRTLYSKIESDKSYSTTELRIIFEEWFSNVLRTEVFPQYSEFQMAKVAEAKKEAKGTAYDELMSLTGLGEAKKLIDQAIDFHRIQKFLASQDVNRERPSQHMVFTGNPGSAKTTVARLFAQIMRENELLSSGHIVEVGRADLVGQFVGHTAPLVKRCFKRAKGGVLFIDEAYSLFDDKDGLFGDEAINTIVQEMENNRNNVVVIFAGYPDKMEKFMSKNPGLRSRIAFHVPFPDYSTEELNEIASLVAAKKDVVLSIDAQNKLERIFEAAREESDFGNGRFVRNLIEKAIMAQSSRLIKQDLESLTKSDLATITAEDIEEPIFERTGSIKLGFCA